MRLGTWSASALLAVAAWPAVAQSDPAGPSRAIGVDVNFSTDADDTDVLKVGTNLNWRYRGPDNYLGLRLERVAYRPSGQERTVDERVYVRAADALGKWTYHATVGTDFDSILGDQRGD